MFCKCLTCVHRCHQILAYRKASICLKPRFPVTSIRTVCAIPCSNYVQSGFVTGSLVSQHYKIIIIRWYSAEVYIFLHLEVFLNFLTICILFVFSYRIQLDLQHLFLIPVATFRNLTQFEYTCGKGFLCLSNMTLPFNNTTPLVQLDTVKLRVEAFRNLNTTSFSPDCKYALSQYI